MTPRAHTTDLLIIGGGPAGCAAALMADSLKVRTILIDQHPRLCHKPHHIGSLTNVPGGHTTGPGLADALACDIERTRHCQVRLGHRATHLHGTDDAVAVALETGEQLTAAHAVVCTGVTPFPAAEAAWITAPPSFTPPPLWEADPAPAEGQGGREVVVLGADRPLGTHLRTNPHATDRFLVAYPPDDAYKAEEVHDHPRVRLLPVRHLTVHTDTRPHIETIDTDGISSTWDVDMVVLNIGTRANPPAEGLIRDGDGYCPPGNQHPRIHIAGDLRSPRFQRIASAIGSGSDAALAAYYTERTGARG